MSRTYKDKSYRQIEHEAARHGFLRLDRHFGLKPAEWVGDVDAYAAFRGRKAHLRTFTRWHDWRDYEDDWYPDYGSRAAVRDRLTIAVHEANSGQMDTDWDSHIVYRRRAAWKC